MLGHLKSVDAFMNIEITDVTIKKPLDLSVPTYSETKVDRLFISGPKVRYVFIPEDVNVISNIETHLKSSNRGSDRQN